ncbi:hypothetical protein [Burkholderia diffusa]|uniref:hypothetical protein n=1 Tax=Burkholderia diffusa TaxID=488732 RepID=UPI000A5A9528|nr:hypothetical protein [Burkholderia diffusa]
MGHNHNMVVTDEGQTVDFGDDAVGAEAYAKLEAKNQSLSEKMCYQQGQLDARDKMENSGMHESGGREICCDTYDREMHELQNFSSFGWGHSEEQINVDVNVDNSHNKYC